MAGETPLYKYFRGDSMPMPTWDEQQAVLNGPFDVRVHKKTFIHYLEVIIRPNGTVEYAVPSHVFKLASIYGKSMNEVYEEYANDKSGLDPAGWLCEKTGCISVWTDGYVGKPNPTQRRALWFLKYNEVYDGEI